MAGALGRRWAVQRIHGRIKRQVEAMNREEKLLMQLLPLVPFRYYKQGTRTVNDDVMVQMDNSYYVAASSTLYTEVPAWIYDDQIEILYPVRMQVIRRHLKNRWKGSLIMKPEDRVFNPSRKTDRLLAQA